MDYQCIIVGGGIAGLQAAIQLGRYMHRVLVIDSADGRSTLCHSYHNILGYPNGVSGQHLREIGKSHAAELGIEFLQDKVVSTKELDEGFQIVTTTGATFMTKRILLATGVMDRIPPLPELYPCLGISVYVCPDCDGYEVKDKKTIIIGSGTIGVGMAKTLSYWTKKLVYINHEQQPIDKNDVQWMKEHHVDYIDNPIKQVTSNNLTARRCCTTKWRDD